MKEPAWPNRAFVERAGIELPIVQAPLGTAGPELAAAVSNAGGLGMLGLVGAGTDAARAALRRTRALTGRPFGVNMVLRWPPDDIFPMLIDEGVQIFSFAWGDCSRYIEAIHRAGGLVLFSVGSVEAARQALDQGIDVIVAQGWEAGGHVGGTVSTMALLPAVVDIAGKTPVLAAGGIADGRGIAAAFALGAAGAWIGTRYVAATEAPVHPDYRRRILAAATGDTLYSTDLYDVGWQGAPHRTLRNETSARWEAAGRPASGNRPGEGQRVAGGADGDVVRYQCVTPTSDLSGDIEALSMWAGQGVGLVSRQEPAADITHALAAEARAVLARLSPAA